MVNVALNNCKKFFSLGGKTGPQHYPLYYKLSDCLGITYLERRLGVFLNHPIKFFKRVKEIKVSICILKAYGLTCLRT